MDFAVYTLRSLAYAIVDPILAAILVMLAIMFYMQNRKISVMQKMIIGESLHSLLELTISQIVMGMLGGILGTLLLTYLGVTFDESTPIEILFIISIIFMLLKPRFVCFAYSGAALGLISIVFSIINDNTGMKSPINVNIMSLFIFVGVLHIVEGLLVMIDGDKGTVPVFTNKDDNILGGFAYKRYWAVPIAIFVMLSSAEAKTSISSIPSWWPILFNKYSLKELLKVGALVLVPFYGIIGFNSVSFTKTKSMKKISSGIAISIFGVVISLVALIAKFGVVFQLVVVIFVPLAHEFMLKIQRKLEEKGTPVYVSDNEGIVVLEVAPNSPAKKLGIKSGDKILQVNNESVKNELEVYNTIREGYKNILFKIKKTNGKIEDIICSPDEKKRVGMVLVPRLIRKQDVVEFDSKKFNEILNKLKNKDRK
ncbi:PDZ domain-containing protein [Clostridium fallax]|uniref:PDZ domain (Also known as DHR or GLGF) n=1 Tax=Clostridium fallax TaxID=1533 RepID=A0A1M4VLR6_9CLOT|nr:PDZ domain-containing protein [Clostridium fallax]SHE69919.1 PDZ domain (Also known as DHR or GLGF) [Clostridium fallax]